jgi:antirestriction protein ArdC
MNRDEVRSIARQAFDELVEAVEAGKSETLKEYLTAMGRFHRYSLGNAILIRLQKLGATHVAGFRAWQRLGRYVKKGEHGIAIMAPVVYRKNGLSKDRERSGEAERDIVSTFKTAYVFDISQTEGKPLPEFAQIQGNPESYLERLEQFVLARGIELKRTEALTMAEGLSTGGTILLKASLAQAEAFSVLVHEVAHELMHRDTEGQPKDRKIKETEAEAVAYVVCQGIGLDVTTASSDYIQLYDGDRKTLMNSLERIQRTASEILEAITQDGGSGADVAGGMVNKAMAA